MLTDKLLRQFNLIILVIKYSTSHHKNIYIIYWKTAILILELEIFK